MQAAGNKTHYYYMGWYFYGAVVEHSQDFLLQVSFTQSHTYAFSALIYAQAFFNITHTQIPIDASRAAQGSVHCPRLIVGTSRTGGVRSQSTDLLHHLSHTCPFLYLHLWKMSLRNRKKSIKNNNFSVSQRSQMHCHCTKSIHG